MTGLVGLFACAPKTAVPTGAATQQAVAGQAAAVPVAAAAPAVQQAVVAAQPPPGLGNLVADTLFVYDRNLFLPVQNGAAVLQELLARYIPLFLGAATMAGVDSWAAFVRTLQSYQTIQKLVLFFHGAPGVLAIYQAGTQVERTCLQINHDELKGIAPVVVTEIVLDNCETGATPKELVSLMDLFQCPRLTAWNRFHILTVKSVTVTNGATSAAIRASTNLDDVYLFSGGQAKELGPNDLAGQAGNFKILYEWFNAAFDNTSPGLNPDRKTYPARIDATITNLTKVEASGMDSLAAGGQDVPYLVNVVVTAP